MAKGQKQSMKQRQEKIEAAKRREEAYAKKKARAERRKKIITVIVCIILILGLSLPTMALTVCKASNTSSDTQTTEAQSPTL